MRNGPNPRYKPISYTYPLDGDGMIHAVSFDNGRARYRNRFVRTRSFEIEQRRRPRGLRRRDAPRPGRPQAARPRRRPERPLPARAPSSPCMHHGDHLLALGEVEPGLGALRPSSTPSAAGPPAPTSRSPLGAHNRRHPVTGDLFALCYDPMSPTVLIHHIDPAGRLRRSFPVALAAPSMIHDFVLTERHLVLLIGPAIFDMAAAAAGKPFLQWRPDLGTRIGVVLARRRRTARWIEADAFFVFHFANGFERGSRDRHRLCPPREAEPRLRRTPPPVRRRPCAASPSTRSPAPVAEAAADRRHRRVPPHRRPPRRPAPAASSTSRRCTDDASGSRPRRRRPPSTALLKIDAETGAIYPPRFRQPHRRRGGLHPARRRRGRRLARDLPLRPRHGDQRRSRSSTPPISTPAPSR